MICPCGGITRDHEFTTLDGILHEVKTCNACGRQLRRDWKNGRIIDPTPDHPDWIDWKLTDESWQQWRNDNPRWVAAQTERMRL